MDRSVVVRLRAEVAEFKRGMGEAAASVGQVTTKAQEVGQKGAKGFSTLLDNVHKNEQAVSQLTTQVGMVGIGLTALAGLAVKKFADFDQAMSNVAATGEDATQNITALRDAAIDAGARTVFSASEAAGAIENLAKAGVSATDILSGGLNGALDLAAAGNIAVADAAEIAASALTQFELGGDKAVHVADLLAAGAGKAQGGVKELGDALGQSGLVANQMGIDVEETTGTLTAFASAGLLGSDAGTSFRAMLLRLANPTKESADLMAQLGINAYDAQGNFVGMESLAGQLQTRLAGLTQEQRNAALATIFGQDAIRSASILYKEGADGIREWTEAVDDQGYAAEVAATRLDNLKGDLEALSGSIDSVFIQSGTGANDLLRSIAQSAEGVVDAIGQIPGPVLSAITILVGTAGLVALGVAGLGKLIVSISATRAALVDLNLSAKTVATNFGKGVGIAAAVVAAGAAFDALGDKIDDAMYGKAVAIDDLTRSLTTFVQTGRVAGAAARAFGDDLSGLDAALAGGAGFQGNVGKTMDLLSNLVLPLKALPDPWNDAREALSEYDAVLKQAVASGDMETYQALLAEIEKRATAQGISQEELARLLPDSTAAMEDATAAAEVATDVQDEVAAAYETTTGTIEGQTQALADSIAMLEESTGVVKSQMEAQSALEAAYDDASAAIKTNGSTLDLTTEKGRANQDALIGVRDAGFDLIESMEANGATQGELQATMDTTRRRFETLAEKMGLSKDEAHDLAVELGLIPKKINTTVNVSTEEAKIRADRFIAAYTNREIPMTVKLRNSPVSQPGGPAPRGLALGGAVDGPGTETSDSIPARLSRNEHVWTAAEVRGAGGHAAVENLRAGARAGRLGARYAKGGAVAPGFATGGHMGGMATAVPASASSAAAAFPSFPDTVRLDAQSVQAVADAIVAGSERVASGVLSTAARSSAATRSTGRATR